ncbi:MAG: hypothetical protein HY876_06095, partial [Coriobacteriales bacterium]|nr:hypothetical protein [Coriobacteriales bacterium]
EAASVLAGCDVLGIETNHDPEMLRTGPYPYFLTTRIRSEMGHLANDQAAEAIERLAHDGLRRVIGMHVSRTNNTFELAATVLADRLGTIGLDVPVIAARHDRPCEAGAVELGGQATLFEQGAL